MNSKLRRRRTALILSLVAVTFHILGLLSTFHAVMNTRTSQGAIAWVVSLNTFPYVAVPAYWIFGRNKFQGYISARQEGDAQIQQVGKEAERALREYRSSLEDDRAALGAAQRLARLPLTVGNEAELLVDGDATFTSIFEGIDAAESYILVQFYIVHDDGLGRELKSHLLAKAAEGVKIYFLYDEIGSHDLPDAYIEELRAAGVQIYDFHTRKGAGNRFQLNFRNHRKIVVVDGKVAWVGGHNVGDEYLGKDPEVGHWRDTHMRIEGPAALGPQLSFIEDWHWATDQVLDLPWQPLPVPDSQDQVLTIPTGPADQLETAELMFTHAINSARKRIWIASPYFVPDPGVVKALQLAGLRGVDVRILIPDESDSILVYLSAYSYFDESSSTGVEFYRYLDGFLHQKVMLIDDEVATVGTANFDNRSFRLNFEITSIIVDREFAAAVERMFEQDFEKSHKMQAGDFRDRSVWFRFAVRLARLTAPVQ